MRSRRQPAKRGDGRLLRRMATTCFACIAMGLAGCGSGRESETVPETLPSRPGSVTQGSQHESRRSDTEQPQRTTIRFEMLDEASGFQFTRYDDFSVQRRILEANGGGVGLIDFDRDGWLDVFLTNGCRLPVRLDDGSHPSALVRNQGHPRNQSHVQFRTVTSPSGLRQIGMSTGCAVGDVDADGFDDLYVTAYGANALWLNNGDGTFSRSDVTALPDQKDWSTSAAFADLNRDGNLDLYVVNYLEESDEEPRLCAASNSPDGFWSCSPTVFEGVADVVLLSDGSGRFVDVSTTLGIDRFPGKGLGVAVADLDGSGRPTIYVANDGQPNTLFVPQIPEQPTPTAAADHERAALAAFQPQAELQPYEEAGMRAGVSLSGLGLAQASMGVAIGDVDGNGLLDLLLTHFSQETNTLYRNSGGLLFDDATRTSQLGPPSVDRLGWGTEFADLDHDGWQDLLIANGHVEDRTGAPSPEPYAMRPQVFRNLGAGRFQDVSNSAGEYFRSAWLGRGLAVGDLDRDGLLDFVVSHQRTPAGVLLNRTRTSGDGLVVRPVGVRSNRTGVGVRIELVTDGIRQVRELTGGGSFQSCSARELHFALPVDGRGTFHVRWPSGRTDTYHQVQAGHWILVEGRADLLSGARD